MSKRILLYKNAIIVICENELEAKSLAVDIVFGDNYINEENGRPNSIKLDQNYDQICDELIAL